MTSFLPTLLISLSSLDESEETEHPQDLLADFETLQPPEEEESALALFIQMLCVVCPVQFVVHSQPDILVCVVYAHTTYYQITKSTT